MNNKNSNSHYACQYGVTKLIRIFVSTLIFPIMISMVSCGDNEKEDEPVIDKVSVLHGTWVASETFNDANHDYNECKSTIVFEPSNTVNATIVYEMKRPGGAYDQVEGPIEYRYEIINNVLNIYKTDNTTKKPDSVLSYKVFDDKLVLEYNSGENPLFLIAFTNKAVTFTRK